MARTVGFVTDHGLPVATRAGGHSYGGWSVGDGVVLDVSRLAAVAVDRSAGTATVGAGARLIDVYAGLAHAGVGIPAGSCPSVGVAGLTFGGGIGVLTRAWGLTCDNLTAVEVVTADGRVRRCGPDSDADLFWASRGGGGGSFGVATSFTFRTRPAPEVSIFYLRWPLSAAAEVVASWQPRVTAAEPALWSTCKLASAPGAAGRVVVAGTWIGPPDTLAGVLGRLTSQLGTTPAAHSTRRLSYLPAMLFEAGCSDTGGVSLDSFGGSVAAIAPEATAFAHRDALFSLQYTAVWRQGPAYLYSAYVRRLRAAMTPHLGNAAYVNYPRTRRSPTGRRRTGVRTTRGSRGSRSGTTPMTCSASPSRCGRPRHEPPVGCGRMLRKPFPRNLTRGESMSREANVAAQQRLADSVNAGDIDAAVQSFAENVVDHDPAPGQGPGREGFRAFFHSLASAFPDAHIEPAHMVADDEHVSIAYTLTGTHRGDFHGVAPTGNRIEARGMQIGRFENGQIVERWGSTDELGIMQQIGAVPKP